MHPEDTPVSAVWQDVGDAELVPPSWIVDRLIPPGLTFLAGPSKSGKSNLLLGAMLTAAGVPNSILPADLSTSETTGLIMGLSLEAQAGVLRHTAREGAGVEIPPDGRMLVVDDPWQFRLDNTRDMADLLQWADHINPVLLFVDPLRNAHSLDENDSGGMVAMLQPLQQWAIKAGRSVVVVHHARKLGGDKGEERNAKADDMRGSSALFGLADAVLTVTAKNRSGLINVNAVFKRSEAWERIIQLGLWGQTSRETVDSIVKSIFLKLSEGASQAQVAEALHISKSKVSEGVVVLKRIGALDQSGHPTTTGLSVVETAVRKFSSNS